MAITDLITGLLSIFLLINGATRGFLLSIINPFSIIVTSYLSYFYFESTHGITVALLIGILGPVVLAIALRLLLKTVITSINDGATKPGLLSAIAGAALTLVWGWVFIFPIVLLLGLLPPIGGKTLEGMHNDVARSASYSWVSKPLGEDLLAVVTAGDPVFAKKMSTIFAAHTKQVPAQDQDQAQGQGQAHAQGQSATINITNADVKALADDPRFQKVTQDPEVQGEINSHDYVKLMGNPKVMDLTKQIMSDPETFKKVMAVYSGSLSAQSFNAASENATTENSASN